MVIQVIQENLTISKELKEDDFTTPTCEELLLAAAVIISLIFSDEAVVAAWDKVDPDGHCIRA